MFGPHILAEYLEQPSEPDRYGNRWQYNSQSDRHSKVGCWGVAFDLLSHSELLRRHAREGKIVLGVNHTMRDFGTQRKKKLDLVIARPAGPGGDIVRTFASLADSYGIHLGPAQQEVFDSLPEVRISNVGAVLVALEAKASMTAHQKALPRLYDELNSSHQIVHGASNQALAIAYVQINSASAFASSVSNRFSIAERGPVLNKHNQPKSVLEVLAKIAELPRRSGTDGNGFDGIGVTVLELENVGGAVRLVDEPPAPLSGESFHYGDMIVRMANEYDSRFHSI